MTDALLSLPVAVPLGAAVIGLLVRSRPVLARLGTLLVGLSTTATGGALVAVTADGDVVATHLAGVPPPFAITLVADAFSALLVTVTGVVVLAVGWFAVRAGQDDHPLFHPLVGVLVTGICGAFLTADLFNLFVMFEVMLIASYVLVTLGGRAVALRAGATYVAVNLLASTLLLVGVGLTYAVTGTVNLAELAAQPDASATLAVPGAVLLAAFATKAGLVPVHGWVPVAYGSTSPAVAALFSGLLTKVGVYALYRVVSVVFPGDARIRTLLLVIAGATMLGGVIAALGQDRLRRILSFHITSQVGYMIMGLGLFSPLGLAGGVFYILHHIVVKTGLFVAAGTIETTEGAGTLDDLGGLARRHPLLASGFGVAALSLAGIPPFSGFPAKLTLLRAAFADGQTAIAVVSLVVSLLTLWSMAKIWNGAFWGPRPQRPSETAAVTERAGVPVVAGGAADDGPPAPAANRVRIRPAPTPARGVSALLALAALSVAIGLAADLLLQVAQTAADGLLDPSGYRDAVLDLT